MSWVGLRKVANRMRVPLAAGAVGVTLLTLAVGTTISDYNRQHDDEQVEMELEASEHAELLNHYFARTRDLTKLLARNAAFGEFYRLPGSRLQKVRRGGKVVTQANQALAYMGNLFPRGVGEACFIDDGGSENARAVRGKVAPADALSTEEASAPFFRPTFALRPGHVYQARPYISPDTAEWVVANSSRVPLPRGAGQAIVHYEITVESFRRQAAEHAEDYSVSVVDGSTGGRVFDTRYPQPAGLDAPLGPGGGDRFASILQSSTDSGDAEVDDRLAAFTRLEDSPDNANDWIVVATAASPTPTWLGSLGPVQVGVVSGALLLLLVALQSFRSSQQALRTAALTDPLTGLGNRRKLMQDLQARLGNADARRPLLLVILDLDGFKDYNDAFGHPAGDALLVRLGQALGATLAEVGDTYRIGGDEFCAVLHGTDHEALLARADLALSEQGEGFQITASRGSVALPDETASPAEALRLADQRMYANKGKGRAAAGRQTTDALVRVLEERHPELGEHLGQVEELCKSVAEELELPQKERTALLQAASLHDVGKIAVPDSVLNKPGPLDTIEWEFIHQHTLIGERIVAAAPALKRASKLVRWSHENWDGTGYPDGISGAKIPLGARIVSVCDAYDAMTSDRPYAKPVPPEDALAEIRRCAGTQFDPRVVEAFAAALAAAEQKTPTPVG